jgi:hypothetical protein
MDSTDAIILYRLFLGVAFTLATATNHVFLCLYAGPTYSIALTIVHFDGTPTHPSTVLLAMHLELLLIDG